MAAVFVRVFVALVFSLAMASVGATELKDLPGAVAPPVTLQDVDGRTHRLGDFQGRLVLVHFWATWCPPCMDEMLSLEALERRLGKERLTVLAINIGESREKIRQFVDHMSLDLLVLRDTDMGVFRQWGGKAVPSTWVVDGGQRVRAVAVGERVWDDAAIVKRLETIGRPTRQP